MSESHDAIALGREIMDVLYESPETESVKLGALIFAISEVLESVGLDQPTVLNLISKAINEAKFKKTQ